MEKIRLKHVIIFFVVLFVLSRGLNTVLEIKKQRDLAERLSINIDSYPHIPAFPKNYFLVVLEPGMTKKEVHAIVKEYEQVFHCRRSSEVYYYYSKKTDKALRFEVLYDEDGRYTKLIGEDDNSSMLYTEGCVPGLLSE